MRVQLQAQWYYTNSAEWNTESHKHTHTGTHTHNTHTHMHTHTHTHYWQRCDRQKSHATLFTLSCVSDIANGCVYTENEASLRTGQNSLPSPLVWCQHLMSKVLSIGERICEYGSCGRHFQWSIRIRSYKDQSLIFTCKEEELINSKNCMQLTEAYALNHFAIKGVTDPGTQCTRQIHLLSRTKQWSSTWLESQ